MDEIHHRNVLESMLLASSCKLYAIFSVKQKQNVNSYRIVNIPYLRLLVESHS